LTIKSTSYTTHRPYLPMNFHRLFGL
jgi:hypothetical protein